MPTEGNLQKKQPSPGIHLHGNYFLMLVTCRYLSGQRRRLCDFESYVHNLGSYVYDFRPYAHWQGRHILK